mmetsp:Transcript_8313/g.12479  ORF Transcript_8313/g.12479 Transcript_8313/m.12479 type:complete len:98 (+) Transcript_8313:464-757(+)|eukprot:CAMPEP_0167765330 /NCGR_PEP_ID=MMETSP0110_2-20121227/14614_1 /TAXON_ID=629695 /ORGANISM="Gymnochlora sp., Strain CCMP2014" /LENGTH=97 /DNA_ID=CAMNT_0007653005 /DNA_START=407 /DNA_END=700 /DNA_ORIENTATION=-
MKSLKILKLKPEIDSHDLSTKLNSASKQLQKCHPVKIVIEKGDSSVFQKRKGEIVTSIYETLVDSSIGYTLEPLKTAKGAGFILLSPYDLKRDSKET